MPTTNGLGPKRTSLYARQRIAMILIHMPITDTRLTYDCALI
jgi:hypothetical protein